MKRSPSCEPPATHGTDAEAMRDELDYQDMIALSGMYRRWAIYEAGFTPERRTTLMAWSADLERIAAWVGPGWRGPSSTSETSLLQFLARLERDASRPIKLQHAKHWLGIT
jgi:hypothetical protein